MGAIVGQSAASKVESTLVTETPLQPAADIFAHHGQAADGAAASIFAIVVIYKMRPEDSATLQTLMQSVEAVEASSLKLSIFIADNTPGGQTLIPESKTGSDLSSGVRYQAFPENPGLAEPYNLAIAQADEEGYRWLLTLDQDTNLPLGYLAEMVKGVRRYESEARVAAIVPRIVDNGTALSPLRFAGGFLPRVVGDGTDGLLPRNSSALNSASLLRISALKEIGGYDPRFPLNNSDTALFHRLNAAGFRIAVAGKTVVQHELAIMRRADRMTVERYRQLLIDERNFWDLHMGLPGRAERLVRLIGRLIKGMIGREDAAFQKITLSEIQKRLFTRRSTRVKEIGPDGI